MAKDKPPKVKGIPNKHLHSRTTFLYQAATYLTLQTGPTPDPEASDSAKGQASDTNEAQHHGRSGIALELGSHLHTVSRKGQIRLSPELKRSICKSCDAILIAGRTATQSIVNDSKGGKKPWADVLVISCTFCGGTKRFPVGAMRQKRKTERDSGKTKISTSKDADISNRSTSPMLQTTTDQSPADSKTPSSFA
ncbi:Rpr2-domain-containing protein [Lentithecium fluviatile CBS 122367]|uniref:Rpr2-domain-containing protein n=1 Tax=Lentithecium fluviatile CBS 122367 TaxID=1168545 RepID=A0A6G1JG11_9PLEO|nr:Rpr2-domain-containing protein [Lentithecium fluviatile CBS 122367]